MRLDIYLSTDVQSPRKRDGTYKAKWVGFSNSGKKVGEDGISGTDFDNRYGMLVLALQSAAEHINQKARPDVRILCPDKTVIRAISSLKSWKKRNFRKKNGQKLSHSQEWKDIESRLNAAAKVSAVVYKDV